MNVNVIGRGEIVEIDLAPSAAAYAAGDVMGAAYTGVAAGPRHLVGALHPNVKSGWLVSLTGYDGENQKPALDILILRGPPEGEYTDNTAPPSMTNGDGRLVIGQVSVAAADWKTITPAAGQATAHFTLTNLGIQVKAAGAAAGALPEGLYALVICQSTPDYAGGNTGVLLLKLGFSQD